MLAVQEIKLIFSQITAENEKFNYAQWLMPLFIQNLNNLRSSASKFKNQLCLNVQIFTRS